MTPPNTTQGFLELAMVKRGRSRPSLPPFPCGKRSGIQLLPSLNMRLGFSRESISGRRGKELLLTHPLSFQ